jgi:uncharacterized membrane protein
MDTSAPSPIFQAELKPHRSLGRRGFFLLILGVALVNFAAGLAFWIAGAWPVMGFCGLEVLLLWLAFRFSYAQARAREYVILDRSSLTIRRISARGQQQQWQLQPYWVRVECDDEPDSHRVMLWSHGKGLSVGSFLSPGERLELAESLREALWRWRQPPGAGLRPLDIA